MFFNKRIIMLLKLTLCLLFILNTNLVYAEWKLNPHTGRLDYYELGGTNIVSDTAYGVSWDAVTTIAPSKNSLYDKIQTLQGVLTNSAGLLAALSDETGTGLAVFGTSPTFTTSVIMGDGATIGQAAGPLVAFDDTLNYLKITGANVGIGTTTPTTKLHIVGSASTGIMKIEDDTETYFFMKHSGAGVDQKTKGFSVIDGQWQLFKLNDAGDIATSLITIDSADNVGFGSIETPSSALQVASTGITIGEDKSAPTVNTAGIIKLISAGNNAFYTTFTTGTQTANAAYTLPTALPASIAFLKISDAGVMTTDILIYEPALGNPAVDGYVLSSTIAGVRSWVAGGAGATAYDDIGDPDAAGSISFDIAETGTYLFTGAYTSGSQYIIQQSTGNPTGGGLLGIKNADANSYLAQLEMSQGADAGDYAYIQMIDSAAAVTGAHNFDIVSGVVNTTGTTTETAPIFRLQGNYVKIGNAGTISYADGDGDLYVEDELEVDGDSVFNGQIGIGRAVASTIGIYLEKTYSATSTYGFNTAVYNTYDSGNSYSLGGYLYAENKATGNYTKAIYGFSGEVGTATSTGAVTGYGVSGYGGDSKFTTSYGVYGSSAGATAYGVYARGYGTGTINYGIKAEASGATTNWAGYFAGNLNTTGFTVFTPSTTQVIDAVGDAILANATMVVLNPDADYTLTSAPTIVDGTTGQIVYITSGNAEANIVTVQDQDTLASSNLQLGAASRAIGAKDVLTLIFDGTDWLEVSYANN